MFGEVMSRSSHAPKGRRPVTKKQRRCCMFCGTFASDTRMSESLGELACEQCFGHIGKVFSQRGATPQFVRSDSCVRCKRSARTRLLVAGIAAAICHGCYRTVKSKAAGVVVDPLVGRPKGARARDLGHSRAVRLRARRQYEHFEQALRSLSQPTETLQALNLAVERGLAYRKMQPPLSLVTSRESLRGRKVLKVGGGRNAQRGGDFAIIGTPVLPRRRGSATLTDRSRSVVAGKGR
jgi:hypothetical protein